MAEHGRRALRIDPCDRHQPSRSGRRSWPARGARWGGRRRWSDGLPRVARVRDLLGVFSEGLFTLAGRVGRVWLRLGAWRRGSGGTRRRRRPRHGRAPAAPPLRARRPPRGSQDDPTAGSSCLYRQALGRPPPYEGRHREPCRYPLRVRERRREHLRCSCAWPRSPDGRRFLRTAPPATVPGAKRPYRVTTSSKDRSAVRVGPPLRCEAALVGARHRLGLLRPVVAQSSRSGG